MKKHSNVGADFDFRVEKVRVHQQGVLLDHKKPFFEIKKTAEFGDTTLNLGVREDYTVVQYPDFVEAIESGLEREGVRDQFTSTPMVFGGGARFCMRYVAKVDSTLIRKVANVGDSVGYCFTAKTSHDGTWSNALSGGCLKLACKNGMVNYGKDISISSKHSPRVDIGKVVLAIRKSKVQFLETMQVLDRMANRTVSQAEGRVIIDQLVIQDYIGQRAGKRIKELWDGGTRYDANDVGGTRSLWSLYNAATEYVTHDVSNNGGRIHRPERAMLLRSDYGRLFHRMADNSKGFMDSLLTPSRRETTSVPASLVTTDSDGNGGIWN